MLIYIKATHTDSTNQMRTQSFFHVMTPRGGWHGSTISIASGLEIFACDMEVDLQNDQIGENLTIIAVVLEDVVAGTGQGNRQHSINNLTDEDTPATTTKL